jgi:hypothetical protein
MIYRAIHFASLLGLIISLCFCHHQQDELSLKDEVCFERDILPVFQASCGTANCHDAQTAEEGYAFTDYSGISMAVTAFEPSSSKAYTSLISKGEERMPPGNPLPESKRQLIRLWILQGAKNSECPDTIVDDTDDDLDGIPNFQDNCPTTPNADQSDVDQDSIGDLCDDSDNDGYLDINDNCPDIYNPLQEDDDEDGTGNLCDPDYSPSYIAGVCFERDLLPVFLTSCALSGCHDGSNEDNDFVLTNYTNITAREFFPGNPGETKIYKTITAPANEDDHMPPAPYASLTSQQISNIRTWILEGGLNEDCGDIPCETENITYSDIIQSIIQNNCQGCHSGTDPAAGLSLLTYSDVQGIALSGKLESVIKNLYGLQMPVDFKLNDCQIIQIDKWIMNGSKND